MAIPIGRYKSHTVVYSDFSGKFEVYRNWNPRTSWLAFNGPIFSTDVLKEACDFMENVEFDIEQEKQEKENFIRKAKREFKNYFLDRGLGQYIETKFDSV